MFKPIGYGDDLKTKKGHIELITNKDYQTKEVINRPHINIQKNVEYLYHFLKNIFNNYYKPEGYGVLENILDQFDLNEYVFEEINEKYYAFLPTGMAFQNGELVINEPDIHLFERQIADILDFKTMTEDQYVKCYYNNYHLKIKIKNNANSHYFGVTEELEFLSDSIGENIILVLNELSDFLNIDIKEFNIGYLEEVEFGKEYFWVITKNHNFITTLKDNIDEIGHVLSDEDLILNEFKIINQNGEDGVVFNNDKKFLKYYINTHEISSRLVIANDINEIYNSQNLIAYYNFNEGEVENNV